MKTIAQKIHEHIQSANRIIIIPHQNPDCDTAGSATALYEYLTQLKVPVDIFCATPLSNKLSFLPHSNQIKTNTKVFFNTDVDTIVVLDSGDLRYAGVDKHLRDHHATIINIDHHPTNEQYGHHNLVVPTASSTAEIMYHFFVEMKVPINQRMATSLLAGLITDTDNFTNSATSAKAMTAASQLVRFGGNLNLINNKIIKNKTINSLRLWGTVLSRLEKNEKLDLAYTYITQKDLTDNNVDDAESDGIANFLNNLDEAKITLILKETKNGKTKGSFRTIKDGVDVTVLAKKFNGGGHKKAAGFTTDGTIKEVLDRILQG